MGLFAAFQKKETVDEGVCLFVAFGSFEFLFFKEI
jgi:hypothetical protein